MTFTRVFKIKDWKWRLKSHPFLCHNTCASLYREWLTVDVVSTTECLNPQIPCGCYDVHCCSGPLPFNVTVFWIHKRLDATLHHLQVTLDNLLVCCLQVTVPASKVNGLCLFVGTWFCSGLVCGFCLVLFNACVGSYCVIVLLAFSVVRSKSVLRIAVFF